MSTKSLVWTGLASLLLGALGAVTACVLQVAGVVGAIGLGIIVNAPVIANGGNTFVQIQPPRVLTFGVQAAIILPLFVGVLCFTTILRRRFIRLPSAPPEKS